MLLRPSQGDSCVTGQVAIGSSLGSDSSCPTLGVVEVGGVLRHVSEGGPSRPQRPMSVPESRASTHPVATPTVLRMWPAGGLTATEVAARTAGGGVNTASGAEGRTMVQIARANVLTRFTPSLAHSLWWC